MPGAGVGVVFLVIEGVVGAQVKPRPGAKQRDAVDAAAFPWHMLLIPPAQPAEEIELPLLRRAGLRVGAGKGVVAAPVQMRAVAVDGIRVAGEVVAVDVDDIGQHRVAPFLGVEGQHLADGAVVAEGEEEVFGVIAVIEPCAGGGRDDRVDGGGQGAGGVGVVAHPMGAVLHLIGRGDAVGQEHDHRAKAQIGVMADGRGDLGHVLDKDQGNRPLGQKRLALAAQLVKRSEIHTVRTFGPCRKIRHPARKCNPGVASERLSGGREWV